VATAEAQPQPDRARLEPSPQAAAQSLCGNQKYLAKSENPAVTIFDTVV